MFYTNLLNLLIYNLFFTNFALCKQNTNLCFYIKTLTISEKFIYYYGKNSNPN